MRCNLNLASQFMEEMCLHDARNTLLALDCAKRDLLNFVGHDSV